MVVDQQQRPELPEDPAQLPGQPLGHMRTYTALMRACWATDPAARPNFEGVISELRSPLLNKRIPLQPALPWMSLHDSTGGKMITKLGSCAAEHSKSKVACTAWQPPRRLHRGLSGLCCACGRAIIEGETQGMAALRATPPTPQLQQP